MYLESPVLASEFFTTVPLGKLLRRLSIRKKWRREKVEICSFSSVQLLICVQPFATPWTAARQASLSITNSRSLLKLIYIESVMLQPSHPLSSPSPPAFNPSQHQGLFLWVHWAFSSLKIRVKYIDEFSFLEFIFSYFSFNQIFLWRHLGEL